DCEVPSMPSKSAPRRMRITSPFLCHHHLMLGDRLSPIWFPPLLTLPMPISETAAVNAGRPNRSDSTVGTRMEAGSPIPLDLSTFRIYCRRQLLPGALACAHPCTAVPISN